MTSTEHGATNHETRFDKIEMLTDRVLNWFGFTSASDYRMRPCAMLVAIELHDTGATTDTLTKEDVERADESTGGHVRAMWLALQPATSPESLPVMLLDQLNLNRAAMVLERLNSGRDDDALNVLRIMSDMALMKLASIADTLKNFAVAVELEEM